MAPPIQTDVDKIWWLIHDHIFKGPYWAKRNNNQQHSSLSGAEMSWPGGQWIIHSLNTNAILVVSGFWESRLNFHVTREMSFTYCSRPVPILSTQEDAAYLLEWEGGAVVGWASSACLPQFKGNFKLAADVDVRVNCCLSLYLSPLTDWRPAPCLLPMRAGIASSPCDSELDKWREMGGHLLDKALHHCHLNFWNF